MNAPTRRPSPREGRADPSGLRDLLVVPVVGSPAFESGEVLAGGGTSGLTGEAAAGAVGEAAAGAAAGAAVEPAADAAGEAGTALASAGVTEGSAGRGTAPSGSALDPAFDPALASAEDSTEGVVLASDSLDGDWSQASGTMYRTNAKENNDGVKARMGTSSSGGRPGRP